MSSTPTTPPLDLAQFEGCGYTQCEYCGRETSYPAAAPALLAECVRQRAEIERLRSALMQIHEYLKWEAKNTDCGDGIASIRTITKAARAALQASPVQQEGE